MSKYAERKQIHLPVAKLQVVDFVCLFEDLTSGSTKRTLGVDVGVPLWCDEHVFAYVDLTVYKHLCTQTLENIMNTVRWNVAVSPDVDQSVRMFIAAQGGGRKGDLSRFIEEAVRAYLLERAVEQAKAVTAGMSEAEVTDLIDEAVQWAREH